MRVNYLALDKRKERTWMHGGRGLAKLPMDFSDAKWEALRAVAVNHPHWQSWMRQIKPQGKSDVTQNSRESGIE